MTERKLVTIREIAEIKPIEGADSIECAVVDGWEVVVKKGDFKAGNWAIYFEIDSFLPRWPEFKFLEKSCLRKMGNKEGLRLRTIRLRGQVSQGLLLPLEQKMSGWLMNFPSQGIRQVVTLGQDVTEYLNVEKWDPPVPANLAGVVKGNYPSFIKKTDQERIQNFYKYFDRNYRDHKWEISLKLDGSSFTSYWNNGEFGVCSRNMDLAESDENSFWQAARMYNLAEQLVNLGHNIAIQGELMGPGIQGNRENLKKLDMYVFDIWDIDTQTKWPSVSRFELCNDLGLNHVPIFHPCFDASKMTSAGDFIRMADGPSIGNNTREGLVYKSLNDPNISFKAISNNFLLSEK